MPEDADVDVETPDTGAETEAESPETADVSRETSDNDETGAATDGPSPSGRDAASGAMPASVRKHVSELKTSDPKLAAAIQQAFGQNIALRRVFPGGLKEARELRRFYDESGGPEAVAGFQERQEEINELDRLWEAGDSRAIESIATDYPKQFAAMMPQALQQFAKLDAPGYNRLACRIISSTFERAAEGGISAVNLLWQARQMLASGQSEGLAQALEELETWARSFSAAAREEPKPTEAGEADDRVSRLESELRDRDASQFAASVGREVESFADRRIADALKPYLKGKQLTHGQNEALMGRITATLAKRLQADGSFSSSMRRFQDARDQTGLIKLSKQRIEAMLPDVVRHSYRWLFGGAAPGAAKPGTAAKPAGAGATAPQAWIRVKQPPRASEIDAGRSSFEMRMHSSAVLKNGRRVYWGDKPYAK